MFIFLVEMGEPQYGIPGPYGKKYLVKNQFKSSHNGLLPKTGLGVDQVKINQAGSYMAPGKPDSQPKIYLKAL